MPGLQDRNACTEFLWDNITSLYCCCGHSLADHSRNDDPRCGHCVVRGCSCPYFRPYRVKVDGVEVDA